MTRFARAKGSKASNERVPEASTPWTVMKLDLQKSQDEAKNKKERQKIHEERQKNYDAFVKQTEDKQEKKWAEFPKTNLKTIKKKPKKNKNLLKLTEKDVTNDMIDELCHSDPEVDGKLENMTKKIEQVLGQETGSKKGKKAQQKKKIVKKVNKVEESAENDDSDAPEEASTKQEPKKTNIKKVKHKKQVLQIPSVAKNNQNTETDKQETKKQSPKKKLDIQNKKQNQDKPKSKNQKGKFENQQGQKRKLAKVRDDKEHKRRKPLENTVKINGETKEIALLHGFPILKTDHDRIQELRKALISKGIPKSQVQQTLKLERRKAEKTLQRLKKSVCFQCRKSGHILSECPLLENNTKSLIDTTATGVCFKCGSTEHSSRTCKVGDSYKFAKCFICREQGHISSQCPDNPKGLYPKGGACKLCGDVTHLKKDCPKYQEEQKSNAVFLDTISGGNIEGVDSSGEKQKETAPQKKKQVVKF